MMKRLFLATLLAMACIVAASAQSVVVTYFHGKQRCITCTSIERLTKEVINEHFANEVKAGKVKLKVVDISTAEGKKLAKDYRITWSSLFVENTVRRTDLTRTGFQYAKKQPDVFKKKLKAEIDTLLKKQK